MVALLTARIERWNCAQAQAPVANVRRSNTAHMGVCVGWSLALLPCSRVMAAVEAGSRSVQVEVQVALLLPCPTDFFLAFDPLTSKTGVRCSNRRQGACKGAAQGWACGRGR